MAGADAHDKLIHLSWAGEAYPWNFTFRSAQARQLFVMASTIPSATPLAEIALLAVFRSDPNSADIASMLFGAQRALGKCDEARATVGRVVALAPKSPLAHKLAALPCG